MFEMLKVVRNHASKARKIVWNIKTIAFLLIIIKIFEILHPVKFHKFPLTTRWNIFDKIQSTTVKKHRVFQQKKNSKQTCSSKMHFKFLKQIARRSVYGFYTRFSSSFYLIWNKMNFVRWRFWWISKFQQIDNGDQRQRFTIWPSVNLRRALLRQNRSGLINCYVMQKRFW